MKLRPGVILIEIYNCYLLVADKEARKMCGYINEVDEVGAFIWKRLEEGKSHDDILSLLREEYEVPSGVNLDLDVRTFLKALENNHYIISEDRS